MCVVLMLERWKISDVCTGKHQLLFMIPEMLLRDETWKDKLLGMTDPVIVAETPSNEYLVKCNPGTLKETSASLVEEVCR